MLKAYLDKPISRYERTASRENEALRTKRRTLTVKVVSSLTGLDSVVSVLTNSKYVIVW